MAVSVMESHGKSQASIYYMDSFAEQATYQVTLASWGLEIPGTCLCQNEFETRDHLFSGCHFSKDIWKHNILLGGLHKDIIRKIDQSEISNINHFSFGMEGFYLPCQEKAKQMSLQ